PEEIAKAGGWRPGDGGQLGLTEPSNRIAWLRTPVDNSTTFLMIPALTLVTPPDKLTPLEQAAIAGLKDHLVIVGVRFHDNTDRHRTPLNKPGEDLMSGAEINAQIVAQLIDHRSYGELTEPAQLGLAFVIALVASWAGWHYRSLRWLVGSIPLLIYAVVNA